MDGEPMKMLEWTDEWQARWETVCARLAAMATERGGTAARHGTNLVLHSPGEGPCIHIVRGFEPTFAAVRAFEYHDEVKFAMTDDNPDNELEHIVRAIMSGNAEVSVTDRKFKVEFVEPSPGEITGMGGPGFSGSWKLPGWEPMVESNTGQV